MCTVQLWFLVSGLIAISSAKHHHETTIKHTTVNHHHHTVTPSTTTTRRSILYQSRTCNNVSNKRHAIQLLEEWVKHNTYNAVERLYHDIYHKTLPHRKRFLLTSNGTHFGHYSGSHSFLEPYHRYTSLHDEAFLNGIPDCNYESLHNRVE
ncbi:uncharacterized protein LOC134689914 [Mytilus trossulus]|uniref:uncharacterized protein LOC134689914 n=1 Tax=Mytilus trossulus TaxID=6551 RepID=UPI0030063B70